MSTHFVITTRPGSAGQPVPDLWGPLAEQDATDFAAEFNRRHEGIEGTFARVRTPNDSVSYLIGGAAAELYRAGEDWTAARTVAGNIHAYELREARVTGRDLVSELRATGVIRP